MRSRRGKRQLETEARRVGRIAKRKERNNREKSSSRGRR